MPRNLPYGSDTMTEADVIRKAVCGQCWVRSEQPCNPAVPGGWVRYGEECFHPLRVKRAEVRAGLLLAAVRGKLP